MMSLTMNNLLKAEIYHSFFSKQGYEAARALYEEAFEKDKNCARLCAEMAYAVLQAYLYNWYEGTGEAALDEMQHWAAKAVEVDDGKDGGLYTTWVVADVNLYRRQFDDARAGYLAMGGPTMLKPTLADRWAYRIDYADLLVLTGDPKGAITIINKVCADCALPEKWFYWVLSWACYADNQFEESLAAMSNFRNPRNAMRKNVIASLVALGRMSEARAQAKIFLDEEKAQGITYAAPGELAYPGLALIEDRLPFEDTSVLARWKNDLEQAFDKLLQP